MSKAIAIDGPAASGKSTVAKMLAAQLNLVMVNSGAMYRAVAWKAIQEGINPQDEQAVTELMQGLELNCGVESQFSTVGFNGQVLESELKTDEVNAAVSYVAKVPLVREKLLGLQRAYLEENDVVMEGRDIGTVIFPDTSYKFYMHASEEVRMKRRAQEGSAEALQQRDKIDSQRKNAPLKVADDAVVIDTSELSLEQVCEEIKNHLKELGW